MCLYYVQEYFEALNVDSRSTLMQGFKCTLNITCTRNSYVETLSHFVTGLEFSRRAFLSKDLIHCDFLEKLKLSFFVKQLNAVHQ